VCCCSVLQRVAVRCNVLQCVAVLAKDLGFTLWGLGFTVAVAVYCSMLQCVA